MAQSKLAALPVETHVDAAGNLWSTLKGKSDKCVLIGGHMDSVPTAAGSTAASTNAHAGVEILRRLAA